MTKYSKISEYKCIIECKLSWQPQHLAVKGDKIVFQVMNQVSSWALSNGCMDRLMDRKGELLDVIYWVELLVYTAFQYKMIPVLRIIHNDKTTVVFTVCSIGSVVWYISPLASDGKFNTRKLHWG